MGRRHTRTDLTDAYLTYKHSAKARKIDFDLTLTQFNSVWGKQCVYCGSSHKRNGIDRIDNKKGYYMDNVVPCCKSCNIAKFTMTIEEYIDHCRKVTAWSWAHNPLE